MIDDTIFSIFWGSSANFNRTERIDKCFYVRSQQQTWFSRKDNFDSRTKRDWENGFAHPEEELLDDIASYFGVSISYLLGKDVPEIKKAP